MSGWKKLAAASAAGGGGLNVEDVFSTYLYTGTGSGSNSGSQSINNGIDLAGEGGLVWIKHRSIAYNHVIVDSERGANEVLLANTTAANTSGSVVPSYNEFVTSLNSNGFSVGSNNNVNYDNPGAAGLASWTFRKAPKFFDVVTYTGDGVAGRTVAHNLGSAPGCIILKCTSAAENWHVYHRGNNNGTNPEDYYLKLNGQNAKLSNIPAWNDTAPTDSVFSLGDDSGVNGNGATFVAYLFAHNDGDGEFGPDGGQDIIKCDKYLGGAASKVDIDCGFEPSWVMIKSSNESSDWVILDNMRGVASVYSGSNYLEANTTNAEAVANYIHFTPTGFQTQANNQVNAFGGQYTFIAIRRGTKVPESATEVFDVRTYTGSSNFSSFSGLSTNYVDATANFIRSGYGAGTLIWSRLSGSNSLQTWSAAAEGDNTDTAQWDFTDNKLTITGGSTGSNGSTYVNYFWKRAPGFFDVVAWTGVAGTAQTINHNLGVVPEMIWTKRRNATSGWIVYNKTITATNWLALHDNRASGALSTAWNNTEPTASSFTAGQTVSATGAPVIAYLFASLPGVSKVGSYTGNGSSQTINCGFTSGARFILVKRTDSTGDWYVWDTERGIVAGNDPYLELNTSDAEVTNRDWVDPDNSGFIVNGTTINASSASYIFYAIA